MYVLTLQHSMNKLLQLYSHSHAYTYIIINIPSPEQKVGIKSNISYPAFLERLDLNFLHHQVPTSIRRLTSWWWSILWIELHFPSRAKQYFLYFFIINILWFNPFCSGARYTNTIVLVGIHSYGCKYIHRREHKYIRGHINRKVFSRIYSYFRDMPIPDNSFLQNFQYPHHISANASIS